MEKETLAALASIISAIISSSTLIIILLLQPWVSPVNYPPQVIELMASETSPQTAGALIKWSAEVYDPENDKIFYKFWLKGPATENKWASQTVWTSSKNCTWTTKNIDCGSSEFMVWVKDGRHSDGETYDSKKNYSFSITTPITFTNSPTSLTGDGFSLYNQGRYMDAFEAYNRAVQINNSYAPGWAGMGFAQNMLGNFEYALKCLNNSTELDPSNSDAWNSKGFALNSLGRYQEAIICLKKAIELNHESGGSWNNIGFALMNLGDNSGALKAFDKAIELNNTDSWRNKGNVYFEMKNYNESLKALEKAIEVDQFDAIAWHGKAIALEELGRETESKAARARSRDLGYPD